MSSSHPSSAESRSERRSQPQTMFDRLRSLFGLGGASLRDDIEDALEETTTDDVFSAQERAMLRSVLNLHEVRVGDVMVPRSDIQAIGIDADLKDVLARFRESGHSRLPVHGDTLDELKGMVHIRDFVDYITAPVTSPSGAGDPASGVIHIDMTQTLEAAGVVRPVLFVPPSMQAVDLLVRMQGTRTHMALVIDEFGGTDGLLTIEDIVEVIVGDIADEHDEIETPRAVPDGEGQFLVDGRASPAEVGAVAGFAIATAEDEDEVETIGGLVASLAGRVPAVGETVEGHADADFVILAADGRRVQRLRVFRKPGLPRSGEATTPQEPQPVATATPSGSAD